MSTLIVAKRNKNGYREFGEIEVMDNGGNTHLTEACFPFGNILFLSKGKLRADEENGKSISSWMNEDSDSTKILWGLHREKMKKENELLKAQGELNVCNKTR